MPKEIGFIYTETNGLHTTYKDVYVKNLFEFSKMVVMSYQIGYYQDGQFELLKKVRQIIKPRNFVISDSEKFHGISQKKADSKGMEILDALNQLKKDFKNVSVVVSHNLKFHLQTIQAECFRYHVYLDWSRYLLIDTINFYHKLEFPKLKVLSKHLLNKDYQDKKPKFNINIIRKCFFKLYQMHEKSIKKPASKKKIKDEPLLSKKKKKKTKKLKA